MNKKNYYFEVEVTSFKDFLNIIDHKKPFSNVNYNNFDIFRSIKKKEFSYNEKNYQAEKIGDACLLTKEAFDMGMPQICIHEYGYESINDFLDIFYRGMKDVNYKLIPSIYRDDIKIEESKFIDKVITYIPDEVGEINSFSTLTKLQHYGCPTRLLDLTENPLIALYFACEDVLVDNGNLTDGVVYLIPEDGKDVLSGNENYFLNIITAFSKTKYSEQYTLLKKCLDAFKNGNKTIDISSIPGLDNLRRQLKLQNINKKVFKLNDFLSPRFIRPLHNNKRINGQHGAFLVDVLMDVSNQNIINDINMQFVALKIIIKKEAKEEIITSLEKLGINKMTIYSDINSASDYLKRKYKGVEKF